MDQGRANVGAAADNGVYDDDFDDAALLDTENQTTAPIEKAEVVQPETSPAQTILDMQLQKMVSDGKLSPSLVTMFKLWSSKEGHEFLLEQFKKMGNGAMEHEIKALKKLFDQNDNESFTPEEMVVVQAYIMSAVQIYMALLQLNILRDKDLELSPEELGFQGAVLMIMEGRADEVRVNADQYGLVFHSEPSIMDRVGPGFQFKPKKEGMYIDEFFRRLVDLDDPVLLQSFIDKYQGSPQYTDVLLYLLDKKPLSDNVKSMVRILIKRGNKYFGHAQYDQEKICDALMENGLQDIAILEGARFGSYLFQNWLNNESRAKNISKYDKSKAVLVLKEEKGVGTKNLKSAVLNDYVEKEKLPLNEDLFDFLLLEDEPMFAARFCVSELIPPAIRAKAVEVAKEGLRFEVLGMVAGMSLEGPMGKKMLMEFKENKQFVSAFTRTLLDLYSHRNGSMSGEVANLVVEEILLRNFEMLNTKERMYLYDNALDRSSFSLVERFCREKMPVLQGAELQSALMASAFALMYGRNKEPEKRTFIADVCSKNFGRLTDQNMKTYFADQLFEKVFSFSSEALEFLYDTKDTELRALFVKLYANRLAKSQYLSEKYFDSHICELAKLTKVEKAEMANILEQKLDEAFEKTDLIEAEAVHMTKLIHWLYSS